MHNIYIYVFVTIKSVVITLKVATPATKFFSTNIKRKIGGAI